MAADEQQARAIMVIILVLLIPNLLHADYGEGKNNPTAIRFLWAFGALVETDGGKKMISVDRDLTLHTGDRLKFLLSHKTPCFIYLFHQSGMEELTLLYPGQIDSYEVETDSVFFIPPADRWFALDERTGMEKFHLIASGQRLQQIELLYRRYTSNKSRTGHQEELAEIISAIKALRRKHLRNPGPIERPVHLGGKFRALNEEPERLSTGLSAIAIDISAKNFFSRTFTIDHR